MSQRTNTMNKVITHLWEIIVFVWLVNLAVGFFHVDIETTDNKVSVQVGTNKPVEEKKEEPKDPKDIKADW